MKEWIYETVVNFGGRLVRGVGQFIVVASLIGNPPFFDARNFAWSQVPEESSRGIREELETILPRQAELPNFQDISRDQKHLSQDDGWKTFFLSAYGLRADGNCKRCPETTRVAESIPGMKTAFFSILAPGKHISAHRGPLQGGDSSASRPLWSPSRRSAAVLGCMINSPIGRRER